MEEILVVGKADQEISEIRTALGRHFVDYKVRFAKPDKHSISRNLNENTSLAVFNYKNLPDNFSQSAHAVRDIGFEHSILMLAQTADQGQIREISSQEGTTLLPKPFGAEDLTQLSEKILSNEQVYQRAHARFNVNEVVSFEAFGISGMAAADMLKMSRGGALLRLQGHQRVETSEIIQVHIQLRDLEKHHRMPAQVVYCEEGDEALSGDTFGIKWIGQASRKQIA